MKKTKLTIFTSFLLTLSSFAQSDKNDLIKLELNGKVQSLLEFETSFPEGKIYKRDSIYYYFDKFGNKTSTVLFRSNLSGEKRSDFARETIFTSKYNDKNQRTEVVAKWYDSEFDNKITIKYDSKGNLIEEKHEFEELNGEYRSRTHIYKYDAKNILVENYIMDNIDGKGWEESYIYDSLGKLLKRTTSYEIFSTKYDLKGFKIEESKMADGKLEYKYIYKNDENGYRLTSEYYGSDEILSSYTLYKNNSDGNLEELINKDSKDILQSKKIYKYDSNKNWISIHTYDSAGKVTNVIERKLIYFE